MHSAASDLNLLNRYWRIIGTTLENTDPLVASHIRVIESKIALLELQRHSCRLDDVEYARTINILESYIEIYSNLSASEFNAQLEAFLENWERNILVSKLL